MALALVPAAFPTFLHLLYSDKTLSLPLWPRTGALLHRSERDGRRKRGMPVTEENGAKRAISDTFNGRIGSL